MLRNHAHESSNMPIREAVWIGLLALLVRLAYLASVAGTPVTDLLLIDSATYDRFARLILDGRFSGETVYSMNILYPYVLACLYRLFGDTPLSVFGFQAVLDSASVIAIAWIAWRLFGRAAGRTAGILGALTGSLIFYTGTLLTPTIILFSLTMTLALITRFQDDARRRWLLLAGVFVAVATLARGNNVLVVLALAPVFRLWSGSWRLAATRTLLIALGPILLVGAVTVRNARVEGRFVPIAANYAAFYVGHNPDATGLYVLPTFTRGAAFEDEVEGTRAALSEREGRDLSLAESASVLFRDGVAFACTHPREEGILLARKFFFFWNRTESPTNLNLHFARDYSWLLRVLPLHFGVLVPLALLGVLATWSSRRHLAHLVAFAFVPFGTCLAFFVSAEYRIPIVPILLVYCGGAIPFLVRSARHRPPLGRVVGTILLLGLTALFTNWQTPLLRAQTRKRVDYLNAGTLYRQTGDLDAARSMFHRALTIDPGFGPAYAGLAEVERDAGNDVDALRLQTLARENAEGGQYRDAGGTAGADPRLVEAAERYRRGDFAAAESLFRALDRTFRDTGSPAEALRMQNNIGLCQYKRGDFDGARVTFESVLAADSTYVFAYTNLARVHLARHDVASARACVDRADALGIDDPRVRHSIAELRDALVR